MSSKKLPMVVTRLVRAASDATPDMNHNRMARGEHSQQVSDDHRGENRLFITSLSSREVNGTVSVLLEDW